jgi:RHS repeat-associated protein
MLMPGRSGHSGSGGWISSTGTSALPANLSYDSPRVDNLPLEYRATGSITFVEGFASGENDSFEAYITQDNGSGGSGSGETYVGGGYRYGFNGKENDDEVKGEGNQQDYGMRIYDPRLGRFLSVDPITKSYPWYTPYQFAGNTPTVFIDLDGGEPKDPGKFSGQGGQAPIYSKDNQGKETASKELHKWVWDKASWTMTNFAVTHSELKSIFPKGGDDHLNNIEATVNLKGAAFGITNYNILSHYLAQAGHETGGFTKSATIEGGKYKSVEYVGGVFGKKSNIYKRVSKDPSILNDEKRFYNIAYANKNGNGNEVSGDGWNFRGRGYFQLTGKENYAEFTKFYQKTYVDNTNFTSNPELIGTNNRFAILSSMWFFNKHTVPVIQVTNNFKTITETVNARAVGLKERLEIYNKAVQTFK